MPQGGNTGLVGGSVAVHDEIVVSLQNMNQIRSFDGVSGILTCDAGCILEVLDNHLAQFGFTMPLGRSQPLTLPCVTDRILFLQTSVRKETAKSEETWRQTLEGCVSFDMAACTG